MRLYTARTNLTYSALSVYIKTTDSPTKVLNRDRGHYTAINYRP